MKGTCGNVILRKVQSEIRTETQDTHEQLQFHQLDFNRAAVCTGKRQSSGAIFSFTSEKRAMENNKPTKADPHDHDNQLPKDVLNNVQDPDSFRDPLEVEKEKDPNIERLTPLTNRQDQLPGKKDV